MTDRFQPGERYWIPNSAGTLRVKEVVKVPVIIFEDGPGEIWRRADDPLLTKMVRAS